MSEQHGIKVQIGRFPRQTRIEIDGQDVTRQCSRIQIDAPADALPTLTFTFYTVGGDPPLVLEGTLLVADGALAGVLP